MHRFVILAALISIACSSQVRPNGDSKLVLSFAQPAKQVDLGVAAVREGRTVAKVVVTRVENKRLAPVNVMVTALSGGTAGTRQPVGSFALYPVDATGTFFVALPSLVVQSSLRSGVLVLDLRLESGTDGNSGLKLEIEPIELIRSPETR
jgi:hypothetical protein